MFKSTLQCFKFFSMYAAIISGYFAVFSHLVQAKIMMCEDVHPTHSFGAEKNCSLVCSSNFHHYVANTESNELSLCKENSSAILCISHADCKHHHAGAFCKTIPCLCKSSNAAHPVYIIEPRKQKPDINACVVSTKFIDPNLPIIPFPWRTLLVVCGVITSLLVCLVAIRWIVPFVQVLKWKLVRNQDSENTTTADDGANLFPSITSQNGRYFVTHLTGGIPQVRVSNTRSPHREQNYLSSARYINRSDSSVQRRNQDRPPPYEVAVQATPPTYEELEELQPLNLNGQSDRQQTDLRNSSNNENVISTLSVTSV